MPISGNLHILTFHLQQRELTWTPESEEEEDMWMAENEAPMHVQ